jgi:hypothetical protein
MKFRERAILLRELTFEPSSAHSGSYQRLYIGDEFCERRLPTPALLAKAVGWAEANGRKITLVTPSLSDEGLQRLSELLDLLGDKKSEKFEVVINDFGGLSLLNSRYKGRFLPVLGRLLMPKSLSMTSGVDVFREFLEFTRKWGITGLEFNTLPFSESLQSQMAEYGLASHLYLPYRFMAVTRFCTCVNGYALNYRDATREAKSGRARTPHCCNRGCIDHFSVMTGKLLGAGDKVWVKGNTWFVRHEESSYQNKPFTVDRVVNNAHSIDGSFWDI